MYCLSAKGLALCLGRVIYAGGGVTSQQKGFWDGRSDLTLRPGTRGPCRLLSCALSCPCCALKPQLCRACVTYNSSHPVNGLRWVSYCQAFYRILRVRIISSCQNSRELSGVSDCQTDWDAHTASAPPPPVNTHLHRITPGSAPCALLRLTT